MKRLFCIAIASATCLATASSAEAVTLSQIGSGHSFNSPVYVTQPPNGGPLLVVEQTGVIRAIKSNHVRTKPFLNIRSRVRCCGEQGLLSLAFPPNYKTSHRFYVYYNNRSCTNHSGDVACNIEVDEFQRARHNAYVARASSRRRVLIVNHRAFFSNHNGGTLQFDHKGRLLISIGDGGSGGDPYNNAQNKNSLLGKLLRINPRKHRHRRYTIPGSNPYVGRSGRDEIYARGLRNPWRFSIDRAGNAERIVIGDVGQNTREEVDYKSLAGTRGANFGWHNFEGFLTYPGGTVASSQPDPPIFDYDHSGGGCSIIGGYVVRDPALATTLAGRYVYTDLCLGQLRSLVPGPSAASSDRSEGVAIPGGSPVSFGRDKAGHIYVVSQGSGGVYRLAP